jgi:AraC-like DNA-binding protein
MPGSAVRSFRDPWEHQAFFRAADMKVLVTDHGDYSSELTRIDLHRLWMQRNQTSLPQITHLANHAYRCPISFLTDAQQAPIYRNGKEVQPGTIIVGSPRAEYHYRMPVACRIGFMSLVPDDLTTLGRAIAGYDLTAPTETRLVCPSEHLMTRLLRLHEAAGHLAATVPEVLAHAEVARAIEQELVRTMICCLTEGTEVARDHTAHVPVIKRLENYLQQNTDRSLYVTEICAAIGVSDRTLRLHCMEHFGMSPHRYLWLRRMNLAQRALTLADPDATTVTTIANDYGFAELGRFAVEYRKLFGESPSATHRRVPD